VLAAEGIEEIVFDRSLAKALSLLPINLQLKLEAIERGRQKKAASSTLRQLRALY